MSVGTSFRLAFPRKRAGREIYDCVVVGAGPAGLTAAIYLARFGLKTVVVTKDIGGKMAIAPLVDDYPGVPEVPGSRLASLFEAHVRKFGVDIVAGNPMDNLRREGDLWCVETVNGDVFCGYAVIIAIGCEKRKLGVPGEDRLVGKGVSYCAVCDAPFFKDKVVAVVGGGDSALSSAIHLASYAKKVYIIHRRDRFRVFQAYVEKVLNEPKIELLLNTVVVEIIGKDRVEAAKIRNVVSGEERILPIDGVFIEIGSEPPVNILKKIGLELDEKGYIAVKPDMSTNLPGVFAAGDVAGGPCKKRFEQIVVAAAEGALAADSVYHYILSLRKGGEHR
ncbi:MAG: FAD-dependent oxidoreductase [Ignisphaera sp.]